jgi:hypothetical protein
MESLTINIINPDAIPILKGMEHAGLIAFPDQEKKHKNLAQLLRGSISISRAKEMIETINKDRAEWEQRY